MLSENIKKYRRLRKLSQDDLAVKLNIVRQTLSKWENGLSVPDAYQLIKLADILEVSVNELLGTQLTNPENMEKITAELVKANAKIAELTEIRRIHAESGRVRGLIMFLAFISTAVAFAIQNEIAAISCMTILLLTALIILYKNLVLLTNSANETETRYMKTVTYFDVFFIILVSVFAIFIKANIIHIPEKENELFAAALVSVVIIFSGIISPRLPFNRHTGLRLPWTVQNEETWNIAHKVLGIIALPLGLVYMALTFLIGNFEMLTLVAVLIWIGVPGLISLLYVLK